MRSMKGFRNILVHEYGAIDNAIVFKMATTRFEDIEIFRNEVIHALEKHKA